MSELAICQRDKNNYLDQELHWEVNFTFEATRIMFQIKYSEGIYWNLPLDKKKDSDMIFLALYWYIHFYLEKINPYFLLLPLNFKTAFTTRGSKKTLNVVMRCAIWYHLHNLKNVKNTHGGVLPLVKLQAFSL